MKRKTSFLSLLGISALMVTLSSCDNDDENVYLYRPTALVTVCPNADGSFIMNLDNTTQLKPTNMATSPFGEKEVRALVNYTETAASELKDNFRNVHINWIDSIRTKMPVETAGEENDLKFGNDPIEIVNDWVTIAEDGYLTLRIRTLWGATNAKHIISLLTGTNPDNPYELELRHDAQGDIHGRWGDALIAFNLNDLPRTDDNTATIKLKWKSFSGEKTVDFDLQMRPQEEEIDPTNILYSKSIE